MSGRTMVKVLIVDDEAGACQSLQSILVMNRSRPEFKFSVETTTDPDQLFEVMGRFEPDVILLDIRFGNDERYGLRELLPRLTGGGDYQTAVIMVTGHRGPDTEQIVEAMGWSSAALLDKTRIKEVLADKVVEVYKDLRGDQ